MESRPPFCQPQCVFRNQGCTAPLHTNHELSRDTFLSEFLRLSDNFFPRHPQNLFQTPLGISHVPPCADHGIVLGIENSHPPRHSREGVEVRQKSRTRSPVNRCRSHQKADIQNAFHPGNLDDRNHPIEFHPGTFHQRILQIEKRQTLLLTQKPRISATKSERDRHIVLERTARFCHGINARPLYSSAHFSIGMCRNS